MIQVSPNLKHGELISVYVLFIFDCFLTNKIPSGEENHREVLNQKAPKRPNCFSSSDG